MCVESKDVFRSSILHLAEISVCDSFLKDAGPNHCQFWAFTERTRTTGSRLGPDLHTMQDGGLCLARLAVETHVQVQILAWISSLVEYACWEQVELHGNSQEMIVFQY